MKKNILILVITGFIGTGLLAHAQIKTITASGRLVAPGEISGWRLIDNTPGHEDYELTRLNCKTDLKQYSGKWVEITGIPDESNCEKPLIALPLVVQSIKPSKETPVSDEKIEVSGQLKRTVEAGGWLLTSTDTGEKYLIINAEEYEDNEWFSEGNWVTITGEPKEDVSTIFMQGIPFETENIELLFCGCE